MPDIYSLNYADLDKIRQAVKCKNKKACVACVA